MGLGEHWRASPHELAHLNAAWSDYYRARGVVELPPELTLGVVMLTYAGGNEHRRAHVRALWGVAVARARGRNHGDRKDAPRAPTDSSVSAA
jgi:hypothetical protein